MQTNDDAQPKAEENGGAEDLAAMTETDTIPAEKPPASFSNSDSNQWKC